MRVEADVSRCPPRPARIDDYNERSRRAGYRRDAQRTRTGESLHRRAVSTLILDCLSPLGQTPTMRFRADLHNSRHFLSLRADPHAGLLPVLLTAAPERGLAVARLAEEYRNVWIVPK